METTRGRGLYKEYFEFFGLKPGCRIAKIIALLKEKLEPHGYSIEFYEKSCYRRTKAAGMRYFTGGGSREYNGVRIIIHSPKPSPNNPNERSLVKDHDTTDTYRQHGELLRFLKRELEKGVGKNRG